MGGSHSLLASDLAHREASTRCDIVKEYWAALSAMHPLCEAAVSPCTGRGGAPLLLIFEGSVTDCTAWQHVHPGAAYTITMKAGSDATKAFLRAHDTPTARAKANELRVGDVYTHPSDVPADFNSAAESIFQVNRWMSGADSTAADVPTAFGDAPPPPPPAAAGEGSPSKALSSSTPPQSFFGARIVEIEACGARTKRFVVDASGHGTFTVEPGGHVSVAVGGGSDPTTTTRPYSPVESSRSGLLTFFVKAYDGGVGSGYLFNRKVGDAVQIRGPLSPSVGIQEHVSASSAGGCAVDVLLVAGGTGSAPILTKARWCAAQPATIVRTVSVAVCFRDRGDAMLVNEFAALHDAKRVFVTFVYSRDPDAVSLPRPPSAPAVISERLGAATLARANCTHFDASATGRDRRCAVVCGPPVMCQSLPAVIEEGAGIAADRVALL